METKTQWFKFLIAYDGNEKDSKAQLEELTPEAITKLISAGIIEETDAPEVDDDMIKGAAEKLGTALEPGIKKMVLDIVGGVSNAVPGKFSPVAAGDGIETAPDRPPTHGELAKAAVFKAKEELPGRISRDRMGEVLNWNDRYSEEHAKDMVDPADFRKGIHVPMLLKTMTESTDALGGFLVPTDVKPFEITVQTLLHNLLPMYRNIPVTTNSYKLSSYDNFDQQLGADGITVYRVAEAHTKTASDPRLWQIQDILKKYVVLIDATDELIEDTPLALESFLDPEASTRIDRLREYDTVLGTGAGQPLGWLDPAQPSLLAVPAEPAQAAGTIVSENVMHMWERRVPGRPDWIWVYTPLGFTQLATMSINVGAGGVAVWMPANGVSGKPYDTLFGAPAMMLSYLPAVGQQGDIALISPSAYYAVSKTTGLVKSVSIHLYFDYDRTAFRYVFRFGGHPGFKDLVTLVNGVTTSAFITLAARP